MGEENLAELRRRYDVIATTQLPILEQLGLARVPLGWEG